MEGSPMSSAKALSPAHDAELHLDEHPTHSGSVTAAGQDELILARPRPLLTDEPQEQLQVPAGARGEILFMDLTDESGQLLVVPVRTGEGDTDSLQLEFAEPSGTTTLALLRKLGIKPRIRRTERARHLLSELRKRSTRQLDQAVSEFLMSLADHLLDASTQRRSTSEREMFYDSMNLVKRHQDRLRRRMSDAISHYFSEPLRAEDDTAEVGVDELDLVDQQDFEDSLSVQRMVEDGQSRYEALLEALTFRFAELSDTDPYQTRLPIDVEQICEAFRDSLLEIDIPAEALPEIYSLFSERVLRQLDFYYSSLNRFLADQGVVPDIEDQIARHGSLLQRRRREIEPDEPASPAAASTQAPTPVSPVQGEAGESEAAISSLSEQISSSVASALASRFDPNQLYRSVIDALKFRRVGEQTNRPPTGNEADNETLAAALSALQGDRAVMESLSENPSLRDYLDSNQSSIDALQGTSGFTVDTMNQLDLVDTMFGNLKSDVDVAPDLRPALGELQIPLAKMALLDPGFFLDQAHPARNVVNRLTQLSASGNYPNLALQNRLAKIIAGITENFDDDGEVFTRALEELESLSLQQQQALARNISRVVETQEGQQKLSRAREEVATMLRSRIRPPRAPKVLVDLIDNGWRDLLTLTHVREGKDSSHWKDYVRILDTLSLWLLRSQQEEEDEKVKVERALEAGPMIDLIRQQLSNAMPGSVSHEPVLEELEDVLAGRTELVMVVVEEEPESDHRSQEEIRDKISSLPRLRRWVSRVAELATGAWLTFRDEEGRKRRMQLAWVNAEKTRYIFVNERGQKIADISNIELARQLSHGVKPASPADELSLVDESLYKTLESVQRTLSFANNRDALTRLINRETFEQQLEQALQHARTKHSQHALLYIDIDQFGLVNDVYDETTGDQVLGEFAKLLAQAHNRRISSARIEGDRFAVLLLDRSIDQAVAHAEGIRRDIEASPVVIDQERVSFTVSIGVVALLDHTASVEDAMAGAETAARQAKKDGRNRVVRFHEDQLQVEKFLALETEARAAIEQTLETEKFLLQAQPIARSAMESEADAPPHYEILLAMRDDSGQLSSPQDFIIEAERFGHMVTVDRWVIREVFSWISQLGDQQKQVPYLSINLSGISVSDDAFMEYLFDQISEYGVGTDRICFEITETGTISNMVKAADFVREFKNIGCRFCIDDFGTGLASHTYLRELPVDFVKIDGTFVTRIHTSESDYAMVKSINDLAHFLGQQTIAEFAENQQIIDKLKEIGVDHLQGWGIGKPIPLSELTDQMASIEK
jgi:diguanylate cyclase (GGDEF)-like protein